MQHLISAIFPLLFLVGAFLPIWPYSFFVLLRWVIAGSSVFVLYKQCVPNLLQYVFFVVLLLFNPIFPVHLSRTTWLIIDGLTIIPFVIIIVNCLRKKKMYD